MQNGVKKITSSFGDVSNHFKIRSSIIDTIVNDERNYVKVLQFTVNVIQASLETCAEQIEYEIEDGHIRALFSNVADLLEVHKNNLAEMEKEVGQYKTDASFYTPEEQSLRLCKSCLGQILVDAKESFKVYDLYCSNHVRAEEVAADVLKMTSLESVVKKWNDDIPFSKDKAKGTSVLSYCLKEPLMHLCRTSVLLKALAVFTTINQSDLSTILNAYSIVHATLTAIDQEKRSKLLEDAYKICDDMQLQWDNSGLMNKQGFLTKRGGNIKSWKIRWFTLRSYEFKYFDEPVDEKALGTLNIRECRKVFETDTQSKPNCFGLTLPDRTYFIYATNPSEMTEWMNLIAWKIYMQMSSQEKAEAAVAVPALGRSSSVLSLLHFN